MYLCRSSLVSLAFSDNNDRVLIREIENILTPLFSQWNALSVHYDYKGNFNEKKNNSEKNMKTGKEVIFNDSEIILCIR